MLKGSCLCGAVRYEIQGRLPDATACHCGMCRRHHGSLGFYTSARLDAYRIEGAEHIRWYRSSADAERGYCGHCGSKMFWRADGEDTLDVTLGTLDQPSGLKQRAHIWAASKGDYYEISDGVPMYEESSGSSPLMSKAPPTPATGAPSECRGQCLCGSVSFQLKGNIRPVVACHCGQCRRWHGHHGSYTSVKLSDIEVWGAENIGWYTSSDHARRGFCEQCGSSLFWEPRNEGRISVSAGALNAPTGLRTVRHIFVADLADYYELHDELPKSEAGLSQDPLKV